MTGHPRSNGQYPGHYPPASLPPMPTSSGIHVPYYHPTPQVGTIPPANYAASQSAYDLNSIRIPGLGLGQEPSMTATAPFLPSASQAWPTQVHNPQANSYFQSQQQAPPPLPRQPQISQPQPNNALEEGELSEGEFEDLYEPGALTNVPQTQIRNKATQPSNNLDSRDGSVGDADGSSIYDPHDPHDGRDAQATSNKMPGVRQESPDDDWEPSYPDRERSGSYSPYLSPREVHRKISVAKAVSRDAKAADRVESSKPTYSTGIPLSTTSSAVSQSNGTKITSPHSKKGTAPTPAAQHEPRTNGLSPFRSPLEAKKKAQEAILGLLPLKVRFQDYIDEGVDANVVKALFKDIGLDVPVSKAATAPSKTTSDAKSTHAKAIVPSNTSPKPQNASTPKTQAPPPAAKQPDKKDNKNEGSEAKVTAKSAAEERKDKIARKLAAIAQKTTTTQPPSQSASTPTPVPAPAAAPVPTPVTATTPTPASASASVPVPVPVSAPSPAPVLVSAPVEATSLAGKLDATNTPPVVTKTRAENNAILQQKLAALKKQQAQLAAEKVRVTSNESTTPSSPAAGDHGPPDTSRNGDSTPKIKPAISAQQSSNQPNLSNEPQGNSKNEGIPGLSFPSLALTQPAQGSGRNLKRPVASDFDNYTPRFDQLKRTRTEERLVIDVSDDEDVEMEIGSPIDDVPPSTESSEATARQPLSTFPPLSEGPNRRQNESPASSSAPTPPVHGARIDLLHKRIEETKRLIAEAEAKKAAKKVLTPPSPKPSSPVMQPVNSPRVIESAVDGKKTIDTRRNRIVSHELPRVTATLKEKQDRLRLLAAEVAQLEREVQASLDEQQRLTAEMECLVESSPTIPSEPEKRPQSRDGKYSALETQPAQSRVISPRPERDTTFNSQQDSKEERLDEAQLPQIQQSPSISVNGDINAEMNVDEALQAAILTDNTHTMDVQMADADMPATTDNTLVVSKALSADASPESLKAADLVQPSTTEVEREMVQTPETTSMDADVEADAVAEPWPPAISAPASESDPESSDSDVSMQQSAPELSQSDDESYEPTPPRISDSHGAQEDEQNSTEVIDDILEEPNSNHTAADLARQEPENINNEVKDRSCEEPLLLTTSQDIQGNTPPLEDLLSYKSPLSYFRAYRFHPRYFEEVPGGLKSMTFSAKIDPMREVCSHALAGEPCPQGPSCEYQHFDSMVLPDAEIITQLGSAEMFVGETRTKFIAGLKRVLNELKANKVKDFDRITKAIVKHRQEFLGDKTKVLALDSSAT
ncbi:hypothetical protein F5Y10DRAFT_250058 [Nemania abortiva]|nr:hypothetical protein F5Y10DRAFT_250058 [Nemania abortiva]